MTSPKPVRVRAGGGGADYEVHVLSGLLQSLPSLVEPLVPEGGSITIISDSNVAPLYGAPLRDRLMEAEIRCEMLVFPAGEASKNRDEWARLTDLMLQHRMGRDTLVAAVGGGVTGDLAGFVAATFLRGVPVVQVPTSLVAMIDSSVGGKTGVDVPAGKNLVGAFHPPRLVAADPAAISTLPRKERAQGLAEAVKHGAILDAGYLLWLDGAGPALLDGEGPVTERAVLRSVELKADVVSRDEREGNVRQILNFGHTIGHALEAASGFDLSHGSAVSIGMVLEARLGESLGVTETGTAEDLASVLSRMELPVSIPPGLGTGEAAERVMSFLFADKKVRAGRARFVLLDRLGRVDPVEGVSRAVPEEAVQFQENVCHPDAPFRFPGLGWEIVVVTHLLLVVAQGHPEQGSHVVPNSHFSVRVKTHVHTILDRPDGLLAGYPWGATPQVHVGEQGAEIEHEVRVVDTATNGRGAQRTDVDTHVERMVSGYRSLGKDGCHAGRTQALHQCHDLPGALEAIGLDPNDHRWPLGRVEALRRLASRLGDFPPIGTGESQTAATFADFLWHVDLALDHIPVDLEVAGALLAPDGPYDFVDVGCSATGIVYYLRSAGEFPVDTELRLDFLRLVVDQGPEFPFFLARASTDHEDWHALRERARNGVHHIVPSGTVGDAYYTDGPGGAGVTIRCKPYPRLVRKGHDPKSSRVAELEEQVDDHVAGNAEEVGDPYGAQVGDQVVTKLHPGGHLRLGRPLTISTHRASRTDPGWRTVRSHVRGPALPPSQRPAPRPHLRRRPPLAVASTPRTRALGESHAKNSSASAVATSTARTLLSRNIWRSTGSPALWVQSWL